MIRRCIYIGLGVFLMSGMVFGRQMFSYMGTSVERVTESVRNQVPLEFEIDRARKMIRDLDRPIRHSHLTIAKEEAAIEQLDRQIRQRAEALDKRREQVLRLKNDVATGQETFQYAGRTYTADQVRSDLAARFANYKTGQETLDHLQQMLSARQSGLEAARQKLVEMQSAKRQLELDVENLQARLKMVEVAQAANQVHFDDSQLARTRELIGDLSARLDVMSKLTAAETTTGEIPLDEPATGDIVDAVAEYFQGSEVGGQDSGRPQAGHVADKRNE